MTRQGGYCTNVAVAESLAIRHRANAPSLFRGYGTIVDVWLVGIIPVALYPIMGGKIWCRYWCPLGKIGAPESFGPK